MLITREYIRHQNKGIILGCLFLFATIDSSVSQTVENCYSKIDAYGKKICHSEYPSRKIIEKLKRRLTKISNRCLISYMCNNGKCLVTRDIIVDVLFTKLYIKNDIVSAFQSLIANDTLVFYGGNQPMMLLDHFINASRAYDEDLLVEYNDYLMDTFNFNVLVKADLNSPSDYLENLIIEGQFDRQNTKEIFKYAFSKTYNPVYLFGLMLSDTNCTSIIMNNKNQMLKEYSKIDFQTAEYIRFIYLISERFGIVDSLIEIVYLSYYSIPDDQFNNIDGKLASKYFQNLRKVTLLMRSHSIDMYDRYINKFNDSSQPNKYKLFHDFVIGEK